MVKVVIEKNNVYSGGNRNTSSSTVTSFKFAKSRDAILFSKAVWKELGIISVEIKREK